MIMRVIRYNRNTYRYSILSLRQSLIMNFEFFKFVKKVYEICPDMSNLNLHGQMCKFNPADRENRTMFIISYKITTTTMSELSPILL